MKIRWSQRALANLEKVANRIAADKPLAAPEFAVTLRSKVSALEDFPLLGRPGAYQDARELVAHRNYIVTYRLRADEIQVVQVWHVAQDKPRGD